uniref:C-type lectin domain-containing protein n=1 Tax=Amphilophus citrinellus TaxID=61819 RepID=A0A3Q0RBI0_AMPCI
MFLLTGLLGTGKVLSLIMVVEACGGVKRTVLTSELLCPICSCYLLSESSGSWDAARKDCRDREADLVVIDSPEEQSFLATITQSYSWIGLNDKEQEGQWKWVDGTPLIWTNWATNEPNNGGFMKLYEEDCAHMRTDDHRTWNDCSCTSSLTWICEKIP